jgi:hypothetical protein
MARISNTQFPGFNQAQVEIIQNIIEQWCANNGLGTLENHGVFSPAAGGSGGGDVTNTPYFVGTYTWKNRPHPYYSKDLGGYMTGKMLIVQDIPVGGYTLCRSNGKAWLPVNGEFILGQIGPLEVPNTLAEVSVGVINVPAGILAGYGKLVTECNWEMTNNANAKLIRTVLADSFLNNESWILSTSQTTVPGYQNLAWTRHPGYNTYVRGAAGTTLLGSATYGFDTCQTSYDAEVRFKAQKAAVTDKLQLLCGTAKVVFGG